MSIKNKKQTNLNPRTNIKQDGISQSFQRQEIGEFSSIAAIPPGSLFDIYIWEFTNPSNETVINDNILTVKINMIGTEPIATTKATLVSAGNSEDVRQITDSEQIPIVKDNLLETLTIAFNWPDGFSISEQKTYAVSFNNFEDKNIGDVVDQDGSAYFWKIKINNSTQVASNKNIDSRTVWTLQRYNNSAPVNVQEVFIKRIYDSNLFLIKNENDPTNSFQFQKEYNDNMWGNMPAFVSKSGTNKIEQIKLEHQTILSDEWEYGFANNLKNEADIASVILAHPIAFTSNDRFLFSTEWLNSYWHKFDTDIVGSEILDYIVTLRQYPGINAQEGIFKQSFNSNGDWGKWFDIDVNQTNGPINFTIEENSVSYFDKDWFRIGEIIQDGQGIQVFTTPSKVDDVLSGGATRTLNYDPSGNLTDAFLKDVVLQSHPDDVLLAIDKENNQSQAVSSGQRKTGISGFLERTLFSRFRNQEADVPVAGFTEFDPNNQEDALYAFLVNWGGQKAPLINGGSNTQGYIMNHPLKFQALSLIAGIAFLFAGTKSFGGPIEANNFGGSYDTKSFWEAAQNNNTQTVGAIKLRFPPNSWKFQNEELLTKQFRGLQLTGTYLDDSGIAFFAQEDINFGNYQETLNDSNSTRWSGGYYEPDKWLFYLNADIERAPQDQEIRNKIEAKNIITKFAPNNRTRRNIVF